MRTPLTLALALSFLIGCGNNEDNNTPDNDMQSQDMMSDMPKMSASDCTDTQWFDPATNTCNICPAPALVCTDINVGGAQINAKKRTLLFNFNPNVRKVVKVDVMWEEEVLFCNQDTGECSPETRDKTESVLVNDNIALLTIPESSKGHKVKIQSMVIEDTCGTKSMVSIEAAWDVDNNSVTKSLTCS